MWTDLLLVVDKRNVIEPLFDRGERGPARLVKAWPRLTGTIPPTTTAGSMSAQASAKSRVFCALRVFFVAAVVLGACSGRGRADNPESTVNLFIAAARGGDRVAVYQLLGPETRAKIVDLLASSHQGGRNIVRPEDFFSVGWAPPAWEPAGVRTVQRDRDRAEVEVYSAAGDRHSLTLVREGKEWKIELPWG